MRRGDGGGSSKTLRFWERLVVTPGFSQKSAEVFKEKGMRCDLGGAKSKRAQKSETKSAGERKKSAGRAGESEGLAGRCELCGGIMYYYSSSIWILSS